MTSRRTATSCDEQPSRRQRYEAIRERHCWEVHDRLPDHLDRLTWTAERLRDERERRLRALLRAAADRSSWHRQRLAGLDLDRITEDDLGAIPPMTKNDLIANFDQIVIAPGITRDLVETHIASLNEDAYLLDRYHAVASGGSSGQRGIFVYDWTGWVDAYLGMVRYMFWLRARAGQAGPRAVRMAVVAAGRASHMSSALPQTYTDPTRMTVRRFPISLPLPQIVAGLNGTQPDVLLGYPTALRELADEASRGTLSIAPRIVISVSEPLLPEIRATVEAVWGVTVQNWWASSEAGGMANGCGQGPGMHLSDDLIIVEPVDEAGRPVPFGTPSAKIFVTNLFNLALPLIRFEITDEVTFVEGSCPCGSTHRRVEDVHGRLDDCFVYDGVGTIHPLLFRSPLGREAGIVEYQVRQTSTGADIGVRCAGQIDLAAVRAQIAAALVERGLVQPTIEIAPVDGFERQSTGKLKRFVPLARSGERR